MPGTAGDWCSALEGGPGDPGWRRIEPLTWPIFLPYEGERKAETREKQPIGVRGWLGREIADLSCGCGPGDVVAPF